MGKLSTDPVCGVHDLVLGYEDDEPGMAIMHWQSKNEGRVAFQRRYADYGGCSFKT